MVEILSKDRILLWFVKIMGEEYAVEKKIQSIKLRKIITYIFYVLSRFNAIKELFNQLAQPNNIWNSMVIECTLRLL